MARFLSVEWFAEIAAEEPVTPTPERQLVLEQVVRDTPEGEVRYRVVAGGGTAHIEPVSTSPPRGATAPADLTISSDWPTAAAIAQGRLSAQAALMAGRLRVHGSLARLSQWTAELAGLDPVPPAVRRRTTY
jgi:hypothetical protein